MKLARQINLAILTTLLLVVLLIGALTYFGVRRGFDHYVRGLEESRLEPAVERLTQLYASDHSWDALRADPRRFGEMLRRERPADSGSTPPLRPPRPPGEDPPPAGPDQGRRGVDPLELPPRVTLYDEGRRPVVGDGDLDSSGSQIPLVVNGRTVGWLGVRPITRIDDELDLQYFEQIRSQLLAITAVALLLGLLTAGLLTRRILRPIEALAEGARRLTAGHYEARIGLSSNDELGRLARDFDSLAITLAEDASARRRWVADTSHELRTPITVLIAEIEAMIDGIRPTDAAALSSLHVEVSRLSKLVDDLGDLARSDRDALDLVRIPMSAVEALRESIAGFRGRFEQRRIRIELDVHATEHVLVAGDRARLQQVFANLLENSLRYTDPGGVLRVSATTTGDALRMTLDDSAPCPPKTALPHLFERLYRADASRSREHGGSGLGLAISQRLVEAHEGQIVATESPLGGLRIELTLPLVGEAEAGPQSVSHPPVKATPKSH